MTGGEEDVSGGKKSRRALIELAAGPLRELKSCRLEKQKGEEEKMLTQCTEILCAECLRLVQTFMHTHTHQTARCLSQLVFTQCMEQMNTVSTKGPITEGTELLGISVCDLQ